LGCGRMSYMPAPIATSMRQTIANMITEFLVRAQNPMHNVSVDLLRKAYARSVRGLPRFCLADVPTTTITVKSCYPAPKACFRAPAKHVRC
jgi:hypothetical protein